MDFLNILFNVALAVLGTLLGFCLLADAIRNRKGGPQ